MALTEAEKLAYAKEFAVGDVMISESAKFPGKWVVSRRDSDDIMYRGIYGGWIHWRMLDLSNELHHLRVVFTLDDAFNVAIERMNEQSR